MLITSNKFTAYFPPNIRKIIHVILLTVYKSISVLSLICSGYLGPGGPLVPWNGTYGGLENCTGGAAAYIDKWILGKNHIYQHPTVKIIYLTDQPHDPEGILGSITSIFITFLGLQVRACLFEIITSSDNLLN